MFNTLCYSAVVGRCRRRLPAEATGAARHIPSLLAMQPAISVSCSSPQRRHQQLQPQQQQQKQQQCYIRIYASHTKPACHATRHYHWCLLLICSPAAALLCLQLLVTWLESTCCAPTHTLIMFNSFFLFCVFCSCPSGLYCAHSWLLISDTHLSSSASL